MGSVKAFDLRYARLGKRFQSHRHLGFSLRVLHNARKLAGQLALLKPLLKAIRRLLLGASFRLLLPEEFGEFLGLLRHGRFDEHLGPIVEQSSLARRSRVKICSIDVLGEVYCRLLLQFCNLGNASF